METDHQLVNRILGSGDTELFSELVLRHQSALRGWLRQLSGQADLADDLTQETFCRAYQKLRTWKQQGKFSSWLFGIAYNLWRDELKKQKVREKFEWQLDESTDAEVYKWTADITDALHQLPLEEKMCMSLCYQQGMTHEEAAEVLEVPLGTLKTNLTRAKEKLRRHFQHPER